MLSDDEAPVEVNNVKVPSWVIFFVVLLFVISVFGFIFFNRYSASIHNYKRSIASFQENDLEAAEKYITRASDLVPNSTDILSFKYYVVGFKNYFEENYDGALDSFKKYLTHNSDDEYIDQLVASMEISNAFDKKDYGKMVEYSAKLYEDYREDPLCILQLASAIACQYATSKKTEDLNRVKELIEEARAFELDDSHIDYIERIEYRLASKNIISKTEYNQLKKEGKL